MEIKRCKLDKKAEPGVFIGYSETGKAYRIFQPQNGKILVSRDVKFMENKQWSWEDSVKKHEPEVPQDSGDDKDDVPIRGTRSLSEIYEKCNVAILEPAEFKEVEYVAATTTIKQAMWLRNILADLRIKNETQLNLQDIPTFVELLSKATHELEILK
ncbi:hypothetical protein L6164_001113 [Bauhinia variegata]|uniref:Uncharacterized protein n=1 Tax=Bauhinia variegata TaxID=167791 RepID=A0ACB9Q8I2_BAUVA|nr:hypothetical protein L6164_001113 [Bauhinia variegata]